MECGSPTAHRHPTFTSHRPHAPSGVVSLRLGSRCAMVPSVNLWCTRLVGEALTSPDGQSRSIPVSQVKEPGERLGSPAGRGDIRPP